MVYKEISVEKKSFTARDAAELVELCNGYKAEILLQKPAMKSNAKSLMGVISAGIRHGDKLTVIVTGDREEEALSKVSEFLTKE